MTGVSMITTELIEYKSRSEELFFYSPYNFIRTISPAKIASHLFSTVISKFGKTEKDIIIEILTAGERHFFLVSFLEWDTNYFNKNTYKLFTVLYSHQNLTTLASAVKQFKHVFFNTDRKYLFIEIPSEDVLLQQALTDNRFKLLETRLTYFNDMLGNFKNERFCVRKAGEADVLQLKQTAKVMRNKYDRFHADKVFDNETADNFLSTYIENSVNGFADLILVPAENGIPSDSFLTANYLKQDWEELGVKVSKMVLSSVSSATNRGWYIKLITEMTYYLRDEIGSECIFMNTQSTNRAVYKTWEKSGYRLGAVAHVLAFTDYPVN
ncbi:MAG: hypothetical protein H7296_15565 [Bacteroidia bacterium]|nr:hypothetical protein [Bacteroidia bacterium]